MIKTIFMSFILALGFSCGEKADDATTDAVSDNDTNDDDEKTSDTGSLAIGSPNLGALIKATNTELSSSNQSLDLDQDFIESLPEGSLEIDTNEENSDTQLRLATDSSASYLSKFEWYFSNIQISIDGKKWVELHSGDPVTFDLIGGTTADKGLEISKVEPGTYKYVYVEVPKIIWQRDKDSCQEGTMDVNLATILTTPVEVKSFFGENDFFDILFNYDPQKHSDVQASIDEENDIENQFDYLMSVQTESPKSFSESKGLTKSEGFEYDDFFFYLHNGIEIVKSKSTSLVITVVPDPGIFGAEECDFAPGKPQFIFGTQDQISQATAFSGAKSN